MARHDPFPTPATPERAKHANRLVWVILLSIVLVMLAIIALTLHHKYGKDPYTGQAIERVQ